MESARSILSEGWVGTVVGLIGIAVAILFYIRSKGKALIGYQQDQVTLVGGKGPAFAGEVEIRFAGTVVPTVAASNIVIWNCGQRTINGADVVTTDPLRLELHGDGSILRSSIVSRTRAANGCQLHTQTPKVVNIEFEFLDPGDGLAIELIHSTATRGVQVVGTVKGMRSGFRNYGFATISGYGRRRRTRMMRMGYAAIVAGMAGAVAALVAPQWLWEAGKLEGSNRILGAAAGAGYTLFGGYIVWSRRRRYPADLQLFSDDG